MGEANNEATTNFEGSSLVENSKQERLYEPAGFTDQVIPTLEFYKNPLHSDATYYYYERVPSEVLLEVVSTLPKENYEEERQNNSPRIQDFVEIAKKEPRARFNLYVITKERDDERLTIEGVFIPKDRTDLIRFALEKALRRPDEEAVVYLLQYPTGTKPEEYFFMWWD